MPVRVSGLAAVAFPISISRSSPRSSPLPWLSLGKPALCVPCLPVTGGDHRTRSGPWDPSGRNLLRQVAWLRSLLSLPTLRKVPDTRNRSNYFHRKSQENHGHASPNTTEHQTHPLSDVFFCETKEPLFVQVPVRQVLCCLQPCSQLTEERCFLLLSRLVREDGMPLGLPETQRRQDLSSPFVEFC